MSECIVVGGVYRERCRLPEGTDDTWGSGGRAAAVIAGLGLKVVLYSAVDERNAPILESHAENFRFEVMETRVKRSPEFQYVHGLSAPMIWPAAIPETVRIEVRAKNALVFGMLEADCLVQAERVVYDPQNPIAPTPIHMESRATSLAYVLNGAEARGLTGIADPFRAAEEIVNRFGAEVVIVKQGPRGALVCEKGRTTRVPAYRTDAVWPIGSGDVFAAVFAARWAAQGFSAIEAAGQASKAAALYCNSRVLPILAKDLETTDGFPFRTLSTKEETLEKDHFDVYLAGPFFNTGQRWLLEESLGALRTMGLRVFSPLHEVGVGEAHEVAPHDLDGLRRSRVVFALIDGLDPGTMFELGYARSLQKPVVVLAESTPEEPLKMVRGTDCEVVSDFVSAIYRVVWALQE